MPFVSRWIAHGGKLDRCQLGHLSQVRQVERLEGTLTELVKNKSVSHESLEVPCIQDEPGASTADHEKELLSVCLEVFNNPVLEADLHAKVQFLLWNTASEDKFCAFVIHKFGYTLRAKFPKDFDYRKACELVYLHFTGLLKDLNAAIRTVGVSFVLFGLCSVYFVHRPIKKLKYCILFVLYVLYMVFGWQFAFFVWEEWQRRKHPEQLVQRMDKSL